MHVRVDRERCQGHGVCAVTAPDLFELDDTGLAVAADPDLRSGDVHGARAAEASCPELAIGVTA